MGQISDAIGDMSTKQWGDLSGLEQFGKVMLGGLGGLGQGLQKQQQPQGGGGSFQVPMAQQPQVQLPMGTQGPGTGDMSSTKARNPYFFGYGPQGQ